MLMAQLRGKLATQDWANKEDLLTSAVLGVLKNSSPSVTILLLSLATPLRGKNTITLSSRPIWTFWPQWESEQHGITIEPDVVIEDSGNLVVIEAKLHSDFGASEIAAGQLQLEWECGLQRAIRLGKTLSLLAITNHATIPAKVMERQLPHELVNRTQVYWLSWFQISQFLNERDHPEIAGWCQDLHELFTRYGAGSLRRVRPAGSVPQYALPMGRPRHLRPLQNSACWLRFVHTTCPGIEPCVHSCLASPTQG